MDYNQLKLKVLELFKDWEEYESLRVLELLSSEKDARHRDKAVKMALLRYWRQGLLKRERRHGRFFYSLTEKGRARRNWLKRTTGSSGV